VLDQTVQCHFPERHSVSIFKCQIGHAYLYFLIPNIWVRIIPYLFDCKHTFFRTLVVQKCPLA
jgi:hypothetical protein